MGYSMGFLLKNIELIDKDFFNDNEERFIVNLDTDVIEIDTLDPRPSLPKSFKEDVKKIAFKSTEQFRKLQ